MSDCYVEHRYWPAKRGTSKATLVITFSELEDAIDSCGPGGIGIGGDQATWLLQRLKEKAKSNAASEDDAIAEFDAIVDDDEVAT